MKRRKSGKSSIWYAVCALIAVLAVGYVGVKFGLEQGSIRRARLAEEASSESKASDAALQLSGEEAAESGAESGDESAAESVSSGPSVSEAKRTQSILAEMSAEAKGEDSSRLRGVISAGVPDVAAWAELSSGKKSKKKERN